MKQPSNLRPAPLGILLLASTLLGALAMAHHPTGVHGEAGGSGGDFVHGTLMLLLGIISLALVRYSQLRGLDRTLVVGALLAWLVSLFFHLGAASINGFVLPALAQRGGVGHDTFLLAWEGNQALARLGVYASSLAILCWSLELLRSGGVARLLGLAGILLGVLSAGSLLTGMLDMNLRGAQISYGGLAIWLILLGIYLAMQGRQAVQK